jgi:hypothetical protein
VWSRPAWEEPSVTPAFTNLCCTHCRLRFTPAVAAYILACPECGNPPQPIASLELTFGFRLIGPDDLPHEPQAKACSVALPEPEARPGQEVE